MLKNNEGAIKNWQSR